MRVGIYIAVVLSFACASARHVDGGVIDSSDPPTTGHWGVKLDAGGPSADRTYSVQSTGNGAGSGQGGLGGRQPEDEWAWNRVTPPIPGTVIPGTIIPGMEQAATFDPPTLATDLISAVTNPLGSGGSSISPGSIPGTGAVSTVPGATGAGQSGAGSSAPAGSSGASAPTGSSGSDSNGFSNPIGGSNGFGETPGAVLPNPEPASLALLCSGAGLLVLGRKKSRRRPK